MVDMVAWPPPGGMSLIFSQLVYVNMKGKHHSCDGRHGGMDPPGGMSLIFSQLVYVNMKGKHHFCDYRHI